MQDYEKYEEAFLKDMAIEFEFSGNTELAFVQRLLLDNSDLDTWEKLAYVLEKQLIAGARNEEVNSVKILRDRWDKAICPKLAEVGCPQLSGKGKWKDARKWLRDTKFPEWLKQRHLIPLTCDQLWQQLWETATPTDKLKPVLLESLSNLEMGEAEMTEEDSFSFRLNSRIRFEVNLDSAGYLLLLEKGTSGKMWCLCPSGFAPELKHLGGWVSLPQASSRHKYFKLTGSPGQEEIVAVIAKDVPRLDWLPKPGEPLLQLREGHLTGLLEYLNHSRDCQVLRMAYRVTA
jgi:hypothetical protein